MSNLLKLYSYKIPLIKPIKMRNLLMEYREGFICESKDSFAEIAPLPSFSHETLQDILNKWVIFLKLVSSSTNFSGDIIYNQPIAQSIIKLSPSLSFAYYCLTHNFKCERKKPYNFILGTPQEVFEQLKNSQGTFKIKVGLYNENEELWLLNKLSENQNLKLIIDGNFTLSFEKAKNFQKIINQNLVYFEDPCKSIHDTISLKCNIAVDEINAYQEHNIINILKKQKVDYIRIYKPTILGLLEENLQNITLSSSFESIIGISTIEKISNLYNLSIPGTDTLKFFDEKYCDSENLIKTLKIIY